AGQRQLGDRAGTLRRRHHPELRTGRDGPRHGHGDGTGRLGITVDHRHPPRLHLRIGGTMTDETLDTIAQALTSVPPRAVGPAVLSDADPDVLADALRRAVADLPAAEQRARLAAAFAAMT